MHNKINIDDLEWIETGNDDFPSFRKQLGLKAGGKQIGTSLYKVLPGNKAFPLHCHHANEEAMFILEGNGTLRINDKEIAIQQHDYIALPRGKNHAHQIINTSNEVLIYLCISTMIEPDVMEYPDSNKVGIMSGTAPGGEKNQQSYKAFFPKNASVSYYEGEK